jgi:hypothetical protein
MKPAAPVTIARYGGGSAVGRVLTVYSPRVAHNRFPEREVEPPQI